MNDDPPMPAVLPPGPLSWLFPELAELDPELGAEPRDLLGDAIARLDRSAKVVWPSGPRGQTFAQLVRERVPRRLVPPVATIPAMAGLEAVLQAAALHVRDVPFVRCMAESDLTPVGSVEAGALHLLPIRGGERARSDLMRAERALPSGAGSPVVPFFVTDPRPVENASTRLAASWWGVLPGDDYPEDVRQLTHRVWRALRPDRFFHFLAFENYALAGFDLYADVLRGAGSPAPASRRHRACIVAVCGIDGSGKSSHVAALADYLSARGQRVAVHKIYRHGVFHDTVTDLTRQCAGDRNLHLWRVQRIVKAFDSVKYFHAHVAPDLDAFDVLIFDRYVHTHFAAGMGRYHGDPHTREMLAVYPPADCLFWMDVPVEQTLARIAERSARTVDENPYMLERYAHAFADMAGAEGFQALDSREPFLDNQDEIRNAVDQWLVEAGR